MLSFGLLPIGVTTSNKALCDTFGSQVFVLHLWTSQAQFNTCQMGWISLIIFLLLQAQRGQGKYGG